ncbi:MAG: TPM domain-containing protein [Methylotenera sp.]|nr:TPM domain-containing protein [Oligoflexia bacterium]
MKLKLTETRRQTIAQAIADAELRTSGQIVTLLLPECDDYPAARWRLAVVISLLTAFFLDLGVPALDHFWVLCAQFPALGLGYLLGGLSFFKRLMTTDAEIEEEFEQRAVQGFHAHKVDATADRTGILIFVSLLERRVKIMADIGIHSRVPDGTWSGVIAALTRQIREDDFTAALVQAIHTCGSLLAQHFPPGENDRDELSNEVRTD